MYEFDLPRELQREEHLDRVVEIVKAAAEGDEGPVCARFLGVPMVACPGQRTDYTLECWQTLFEQFQARPQKQGLSRPEESSKAERGRTLRGRLLQIAGGFLGALIISLAIHDVILFFQWQTETRVVTYDRHDGSITVNIDAWSEQRHCAADETIQTSGYAVSSDHGNLTMKITPYCVSLMSRGTTLHGQDSAVVAEQ